jgi:hypothetical protein
MNADFVQSEATQMGGSLTLGGLSQQTEEAIKEDSDEDDVLIHKSNPITRTTDATCKLTFRRQPVILPPKRSALTEGVPRLKRELKSLRIAGFSISENIWGCDSSVESVHPSRIKNSKDQILQSAERA